MTLHDILRLAPAFSGRSFIIEWTDPPHITAVDGGPVPTVEEIEAQRAVAEPLYQLEQNPPLGQYEQAIANGFSVQPEGFVLALTDAGRNQFTGQFVMTTAALQGGLIQNSTLVTIADKDGNPHEVTAGRLLEILLAYGFHYKTIWDSAKAAE